MTTDLEDLYTEDPDDYAELLTQHLSTSPPIQHTKFRPISIFNPTFAKGPYVQRFYQVVFADIFRLCQQSTIYTHTPNLTAVEYKAFYQIGPHTKKLPTDPLPKFLLEAHELVKKISGGGYCYKI